jgi:16S rRNA G966 N2-methylase RsmD
MGEPPSFRVVHGGELEQADFQFTDYASTVTQVTVDGKKVWKLEPDKHWPAMGRIVDGLLYLGGNTSLYPSPTIYLDPPYQKELRRRAAIIKSFSGQDFISVIDGLVKQAQETKK